MEPSAKPPKKSRHEMADYSKKFISLDLETTHLDMEAGRIMEIGAVAGEIYWDGKLKVKFGNSFTTLVNPEVKVSPTAMGLTGIQEEELASAPSWSQAKEQFKKFIPRDAVLLGHNVGFDLDFLRSQGINLKNSNVDTLEMAQTLLPLLPSHSLEYLSQAFELSEEASHRALSDSKNTLLLLAEILNEFLRLPVPLQQKIKDLTPYLAAGFASLLFDLPLQEIPAKRNIVARPAPQLKKIQSIPFEFRDKTIASLPLSFRDQQGLVNYVSGEFEGGMVAHPQEVYLDLLPESQKIAPPAWALCEQRLKVFENSGELPDQAHKIIIKIAIFRHFSPGLDLSRIKWTREERNFLPAVTADPDICPKHNCRYYKTLTFKDRKPYFLTLKSLFEIARDWRPQTRHRKVLLFNLSRIEDEFTESQVRTWNLRKVRGLLEIAYLGKFPKEVEEAASALDLFFGILHLIYLKREGEFEGNLVIDDQEQNSDRFSKLSPSSEKLIMKIKNFSSYLTKQISIAEGERRLALAGLEIKIKTFTSFLSEFFSGRYPDKVYWLKFNSESVDLSSVPKQLHQAWRNLTSGFQTVSIIDLAMPRSSLAYFQNRLGLLDYETKLLPGIKDPETIKVQILTQGLAPKVLPDFLQKLTGPTLLVLPNENLLKTYFEIISPAPERKFEVLAYKHSGSLFSLKQKMGSPNTVLLLTVNAVMNFFPELPALDNLVIIRLPFEAPNKTSLLGVSVSQNFPDHVLPRGVHILHTMVSRFASSGGEKKQIFIADPRILKDYDQAFLRYFQEFPDFQISTIDPAERG